MMQTTNFVIVQLIYVTFLAHVIITPSSNALFNDYDINGTSPENVTVTEVVCYPECENGGTCEYPEICICPPGFEGRSCEVDRCESMPMTIPTMKILSTKYAHKKKIECANGYKPKDKSSIEIECVEGEWKPSPEDILTSEFRCLPVCDGPIYNGGVCIAPNSYQCPFPFAGPSCERKVIAECEDFQTEFPHAKLIDKGKGNTTKSFKKGIICEKGFARDEEVIMNQHILCLDGVWTWQNGTLFETHMNETSFCKPVCDKGCKNQGECVEPNKCKCKSGFSGDDCSQIDCLGPKPEINNAEYRIGTNTPTLECQNRLIMSNGEDFAKLSCDEDGWYFEDFDPDVEVECIKKVVCPNLPKPLPRADIVEDVGNGMKKAICHDGYLFPSGSYSRRVFCYEGEWKVAGNSSMNRGCIAECDPACQNGGFCLSPGKCECPLNTEGDFCERKKCDFMPFYGDVTYEKYKNSTLEVSCGNGTFFPAGEKSLLIECIDGVYHFPEPYPPTGMILECKPSCLKKCLNGGICTESGECKCPPEFYGHFCENASNCQESNMPIVGNALQRLIKDQQYLYTCKPGYKLHGRRKDILLKCENGNWSLEGYNTSNFTPSCLPFCIGECSGHGKCIAPNKCSCSSTYIGKRCEKRIDFGCVSSPPIVKNAIMEYNTTFGRYKCNKGYGMRDGEKTRSLKCKNGKWHILNCDCGSIPPECEPICDGDCINGGLCVGPNECKCPDEYLGKRCQITKPKDCSESFPPVPNALVKISAKGNFIMCKTGYEFPSGAKTEAIWCNSGEWSFSPSYNSKNRVIRACFPTCSSPCLNKGKCIAPETCECVPPFTGLQCQDLSSSLCWKKPPIIPHSVAIYSPVSATLKCVEGYSFLWGEEKFNLTCDKGKWSVPPLASLPPCHPVCKPKCLNGGICVAPNLCECPDNFSGSDCSQVKDISCDVSPRAIPFSSVKFSETNGQLSCLNGYRLSTGYSEIEIKCQKGEWIAHDEQSTLSISTLRCLPVCERQCRNGGYCMKPNYCKCREPFSGNWCQHLKCSKMPRTIRNTHLEFSKDNMTAVARCISGFRLRWGSLGVMFECVRGHWLYKNRGVEDIEMGCLPLCDKPCMNGGRCIAPNICRCPEGFYGSQCQKRYSKTITGVKCQFPFHHKDTWFYGCTGEGYNRPWCATDTNAHNLITSWGVCVADLGMKKVVVTFKGDACVFPFKYRGRDYTTCTTRDRGRSWCATEVNSYSQVVSWAFCNFDWGSEVVVLTVRGEECDLPFEWEGRRYVGCVDDLLRPWCVTATSNGVATKHGYCMTDWGSHRVTMTTKGNICIFPFIYKERTYDSCFKDATSNRRMCASKVDQAQNSLQLEECIDYFDDNDLESRPSLSVLFPRLGHQITEITTIMNLRCVLPFWYNNKQYTECTFTDSDKPWCAVHIDENGLMIERDFCPPNWDIPEVKLFNFKEKNRIDSIKKGNDNIISVSGKNCTLPFKHKGMLVYGCVEDGYQRPWCATRLDNNGNVIMSDHCPNNWVENSICSDYKHSEELFDKLGYKLSESVYTESGDSCAIPFVYLGKTYFTCSTEDAMRAWCPLSLDKEGTPITWDYCSDGWKLNATKEYYLAQKTQPDLKSKPFKSKGKERTDSVCEVRRIARQAPSNIDFSLADQKRNITSEGRSKISS